MTTLAETAPAPVAGPDAEAAERFERDGCCAVPALLPRDEALAFRAAALAYSDDPRTRHYSDGAAFRQLVNVWRDDAALRALTFHPLVVAAVRRLSGGRRMRLWHDQILIKKPRNGHASEFHQDEPYWPVERQTFTISAWIALGDATVEHGCMGFIPGTHRRRDLRPQNLGDATDLLGLWPDLAFAPRVLCPLRAGGSTFHQGFTAHRAGPNETDEARVAFSIIWVEADARYTGAGHCVTDGLGLKPGDQLPDAMCPLI
jgi:ectoine hydroxylase-related dioxygenase (phytanoyl-CoA dioxygenase family)